MVLREFQNAFFTQSIDAPSSVQGKYLLGEQPEAVGGNHTGEQHRLQMQTFSNQRSNALDSANLAPTESGSGHPQTHLRVGEAAISFSV